MKLRDSETQHLQYCKKCLLIKITDEKALYELILEQISLMDEDKRASEEEYRRRLTICETCNYLNRGTCVQCGCYVELRAAKRQLRCPCLPPKWGAE